eukprot:COSAG01_NODE_3603_length_5885_cov_6.630315_10_plen_62_part_00
MRGSINCPALVAETVEPCTRGRNRRAAFFAAVTTVRQEGHSFLCFSGLRGANVRHTPMLEH